jgi:hypothetical protein
VPSSLLPEWIGKKKDTLLDFVREGRKKGGQGSESPSEMAENKGIDVRRLQKSVLTVHTNPGKMTGGHRHSLGNCRVFEIKTQGTHR